MSRTDKDAPLWVQNLDSPIAHDHTSGECVISDDQRERWNSHRNHYRHCNKRVRTTFFCTKDDPYTQGRSRRWRSHPDAPTCWTTVCACPIPAHWKSDPHTCTHTIRVGCLGHASVVYNAARPCSCDDRPPTPTCFPEWTYGRYYTYGGVPSDFVSRNYHRPERARERTSLSNAARLYNSDPTALEDFDFPNRQARNSMRWMYW